MHYEGCTYSEHEKTADHIDPASVRIEEITDERQGKERQQGENHIRQHGSDSGRKAFPAPAGEGFPYDEHARRPRRGGDARSHQEGLYYTRQKHNLQR